MNVTSLEQQKKDSSRVNLYLDGEFICGLSIKTVADFNLYKDCEIDIKKVDEIVEHDLYHRVYDRTINYLTRGIKPEKRLRQYIRELFYKKKGKWFAKGFKVDEKEIEEKVISRLIELGYIDDAQYTTLFIQSRLSGKPRGERMIRMELAQKGVDRETVDQVVSELDVNDFQSLSQLYKKKYKDESISFDDNKKIAFLQRKGYSWDDIRKFIDKNSK